MSGYRTSPVRCVIVGDAGTGRSTLLMNFAALVTGSSDALFAPTQPGVMPPFHYAPFPGVGFDSEISLHVEELPAPPTLDGEPTLTDAAVATLARAHVAMSGIVRPLTRRNSLITKFTVILL